MKVYYISPSTIPSRAANSIHVVNMCEGLTQLGHEVVLFAHSDSRSAEECHQKLGKNYGISSFDISLQISPSIKGKAIELIISINALLIFVLDTLKGAQPNYIISRNIYSAVILGLVLRQEVIYETHTPETGYRGKLQQWLVTSRKMKVVVISSALKKIICSLHSVSGESIFVFHDAARAGHVRLSSNERINLRTKVLSGIRELEHYEKIIGYFGHLYRGRGIEIIEEVAASLPKYAFLVYGGNEEEIIECQRRNIHNNLFFMGFIPPSNVRQAMSTVDVLLMPYQRLVSIGQKGSDTSKWMSPMKLFEYLSMGVPIISSDLPVLREVLIDRENCLLVDPEAAIEWTEAIKRVSSNYEFGEKLGLNAYNLYLGNHTWKCRARLMLELFHA